MDGLKGLAKQIRSLFRKERVERELDEELRFHLEMETEKNIREGMTPEEARRRALLAFGGVERFKEEVRAARWTRLLEDLVGDARYALRTLRRMPAFTGAAVLTLALGIGATTSIFGVVDALFLRHPAGVRHADELVRLYIVRDEGMVRTPSGGPGSYVDYRVIRDAVPHFSGVTAFLSASELDLGRGEGAQKIRGRAVSHSFFPLLGIRTIRGRWFLPEEDSVIGGHPVAVISRGLWGRHFGGDPAAVGRTLLVNGELLWVVGVAEAEFTGIEPDPVDVWVPLAMAARLGLAGGGTEDWREWPAMATVHVIGRLAPGAPRESFTADVAAALRHAAEAIPELDTSPEVLAGTLVPAGGPHRPGAASLALWLLAVTGVVLLIACGNVANLLLSRSSTRRRETAVRFSLGAGRSRLIRQHLTESFVLAVLGGAAGLLLAFWGSRLASQFPLPPAAGEIDARLLLFALALALVTGAVFGILPALQSGRTDAGHGLKEGRLGMDPGRTRLHRSLITVQVALSVLLLIGAGLFVRSLREVYAVDPGLNLEGLLVLSVDLAKAGYEPPEREAFYEDARQRVLRLPGVENATMTHFPPFSGASYGMHFLVPGQESLTIEQGPYVNWVGPGYFETVGTALIRGRGIAEGDGTRGEPVAVINNALARLIAADGEALGVCLAVGEQVRTGGCTRVVGVAENQRTSLLDADVAPVVYLARDRSPDALSWGGPHLLVRGRTGEAALAGQVRSAVQSLRRNLPYVTVEPLATRLRPQLLPYQLGATLFSLFGILALTLAAVGLYGVLGYFVAERRPELGIRRSLGARETEVVRLVVRQGIGPVAAGLALGLAAAYVGMRVLQGMLFGVSARDPLTFVGVAAFMVAVALLASYLPAKRAARVDPMIALRAE